MRKHTRLRTARALVPLACTLAAIPALTLVPGRLHSTDQGGGPARPCRAQNFVYVDRSGCLPLGAEEDCRGMCSITYSALCDGDGCDFVEEPTDRYRCTGGAAVPEACGCMEEPELPKLPRVVAFCDSTTTTVRESNGRVTTWTTSSGS